MTLLQRVRQRVLLKSVSNEAISNRWNNRDLIPLPPSRRLWRDVDFIGLWSTSFVTTIGWQGTSAMLTLGLNVWQAVICSIIAKFIQLLVVVSVGWGGAVWHIGYTVSARYTFGIWGSFVPILVRVCLVSVWYGTNSFVGGSFVSTLLSSMFSGYQHMSNTLPASAVMTTKQFVGFFIYNLLTLPILYIPPEKLKGPFKITMPISAITIFAVSVGLMAAAHGAGNLIHIKTAVNSGSELGWAFIHAICSIVGTNIAGMASQSDFSRFAAKPGNQVLGQTFAVMFFGNIVPVFGLLGTSAASSLYGDVSELGLWNPASIIQVWLDRSYDDPKLRAAAFFASLGFICAVVTMNTVENGISGGMDVAGLWPQYINIRRGSYILAIVSILLQPWQIIGKAATFVSVLSSFGVILGPMVGVMTCDYWVVHRGKIRLEHLYMARPESVYWFTGGFNFRAFLAWFLGFAPFIAGLASLDPKNDGKLPANYIRVFYIATFAGYAISFAAHWGLNVLFPARGARDVDEYDSFGTFTVEEAQKLGIEPHIDISSASEEVAENSSDYDSEKKAGVAVVRSSPDGE